jgi:multiple sugar transport system ATP-binding protein
MQIELRHLHEQIGATTVYVTHDQREALTLGDRIAVMESGRIHQIGTPQQVRSDPVDVFVAGFIGAARTTLVQGAVYAGRGGASYLDLGEQVLETQTTLPGHHTDRVTVALRTDALTPVPVDAEGPVLRGTVSFVEDLGSEMLVHVSTGLIGIPAAYAAPDGRLASVRVPHQRRSSDELEEPFGELVVRVAGGLRPSVGEAFAVRVDLDRVFLFDRAGVRIRVDTPAPELG